MKKFNINDLHKKPAPELLALAKTLAAQHKAEKRPAVKAALAKVIVYINNLLQARANEQQTDDQR